MCISLRHDGLDARLESSYDVQNKRHNQQNAKKQTTNIHLSHHITSWKSSKTEHYSSVAKISTELVTAATSTSGSSYACYHTRFFFFSFFNFLSRHFVNLIPHRIPDEPWSQGFISRTWYHTYYQHHKNQKTRFQVPRQTNIARGASANQRAK